MPPLNKQLLRLQNKRLSLPPEFLPAPPTPLRDTTTGSPSAPLAAAARAAAAGANIRPGPRPKFVAFESLAEFYFWSFELSRGLTENQINKSKKNVSEFFSFSSTTN